MSALKVLILTGLSGSGKSTAARALEDQAYFVVDNLPLPLFRGFLKLITSREASYRGVVLVTDVRSFSFPQGFSETLEEVRRDGFSPEVYFFDASEEVLIRRYSETRRRHPLDDQVGIRQAIEAERSLLAPLRILAHEVIDTSSLSPHQLKAMVLHSILGDDNVRGMALRVQSFGFRHGLPPESDTVFDVRFLPNPHFQQDLRQLTGLDPEVQEYVLSTGVCRSFLLHLEQYLRFVLPQYRLEGKSNLTISVGCTGGRHRSVAIVETLKQILGGLDFSIQFSHRDLTKGES